MKAKLAILGSLSIFAIACNQKPEVKASSQTMVQELYEADDWVSQTLPELSDALQSGAISSEQLVRLYIDRIEAVDRSGPNLQALLTLNPEAIENARALDRKRQEGALMGPLHGIPIVLKDNIESKGNMATTAGAFALKDNITHRDSPSVAGLRKAGALILGKTNLSQWANFRSSQSMSGWSALGGQVRNPHILDRNPCGSSSGSGVAVAASLAAGAVGTETNGSIICPSNVNGIVGFKPTVGLVSQQYIVPISSTQDTAGPMTKTVKGAAMMLSAMATGDMKTDYVMKLDSENLQGAKIGVANSARGSNPDIHIAFDSVLSDMQNMGAEIIAIDEFEPDGENFWDKSYDLLKYEFKAGLNEYLKNTTDAVKTRSLSDIITFNEEHSDQELVLFGQDILEDSDMMGPLSEQAYITARKDVLSATREQGLDRLFEDYEIDVLVSPSGPVAPRIDPVNGDVWPEWAGAGGIAARAGYPHLTVPMGTIHGIPIGVSFIGLKNEDAKVLAYGYAYEQATNHLTAPKYLPSAEVQPEISDAMNK